MWWAQPGGAGGRGESGEEGGALAALRLDRREEGLGLWGKNMGAKVGGG